MSEPAPPWNWNKLSGVMSPLGGGEDRPVTKLGKYRLLGELGRGAMGIVYEAEDVDLERRVAVKVLRALPDAKETLRLRFQREALTAAKLDHPNVIRVYDSGEEDDRMYLVMERVEGRPLSDLLGGRATELRPLLRILEKAALGLAAAHRAGIVHRDVKPANILVTHAGEPKVGDFGLAHRLDAETNLTRTGAGLGTPMYMSPEQVTGRGADITPATDVYALGGILYEMLTGRPPHTGTHMAEIYSKIIADDPLSPRRLNARVPADLETICLRALDKDPRRRYADAGAFADDLRRFLEGESILAAPLGALTLTHRWIRRHRLAAYSSLIALVFALIAAAGLSFQAMAVRKARKIAVDSHLDAGRAARIEERRLRSELDELRVRAESLRAALEPEADRKVLWEVERRIDDREKRVAMLSAEALAAFTATLGIDPANRDARSAIAAFYFEDFGQAEEEGDRGRMESARRMALLYDDGTLAPRLKLEGTVSLESRPDGAEVELFAFEEGEDRRLLPRRLRSLGRTPVAPTTLPTGSYLLILHKEGFRDTRVPVLVGRDRSALPPVALQAEGEDYVFVPGGPFISGGDPAANPPSPRVTRSVGDFFIGRFEVTSGEYVAFLDDLLRREGVAAAQRRCPRTTTNGGYMWTIPADGTGLELTAGWLPRWPAPGLSWEDAVAYCAWLDGKEPGFEHRLPTALEWEKAARGADGRRFPWGNSFDWSFALGGQSRKGGAPVLEGVDGFPADESPYGVRGMAGGQREWCADGPEGHPELAWLRGGSMGYMDPKEFRSATQVRGYKNFVNGGYGFRVARVAKKNF